MTSETTSTVPENRRPRNHAIWLGVLITFVAIISYFEIFARFAPLRDFPWVNLPLALLGFLVSALGLWRAFRPSSPYRGKILGSLGFALSLLLAAVFAWYVFDYSYDLPAAAVAVAVNTAAPDFTLTDATGSAVSLQDYRGKKVVLVFYRGHW